MKEVAARIAGQERVGNFLFVRFHCPSLAERLHPGHFVLARLLPTWDPYLRVALFPTHLAPLSWLVYVPHDRGTVRRILEHAPPGTPLAVYGPLGTPFPEVSPQSNVLAVAQEPYVPYLLGLVQRAGATANVVFLVERTGVALPDDLSWLPPTVEFRQVQRQHDALAAHVHRLAAWADYVFVAGPRYWPSYVARVLEEVWPLLQPGRAFAIVPDGISCGLGLCDRCVVEVRRGEARACRKGPVFDIATWFGQARARRA